MPLCICFSSSDPIPGARNLEFPLENDPNLYLDYDSEQTVVHFGYGNTDLNYPCGEKLPPGQPSIEYVIYQYFLDERHSDEDNFMASLHQLITAEDIASNSQQVSVLLLLLSKLQSG